MDRSYDRLIAATYSIARRQWTRVDTLRPPEPYTLGQRMSRPVVVAGTIAIAVESHAPAHLDGVMVFMQGPSGAWSSEFVEVAPAYIELAPAPGTGLVMGVVTVDDSKSEDVNSLLVLHGPKPWRRLGFLPKTPRTAVHFPRLFTHSDSLFVAFLELSEHGVSAKLVSGAEGGPYQETLLDSGAVNVMPILGAPHVWVTQRPRSDSVSSISLVGVENGRARRLWSADSPNPASIAGAATGSLIQLFQMSSQDSTRGPPETSRIIRLRASCAHP